MLKQPLVVGSHFKIEIWFEICRKQLSYNSYWVYILVILEVKKHAFICSMRVEKPYLVNKFLAVLLSEKYK